jgi:hypothetical protein
MEPILTNMDHFNRGVATVLAQLLEAFPDTVNLNPAKLAPEGSNDDTKRLYARTLEFLRVEGFIRSGTPFDGYVMVPHATLTTKGLEILNSTPSSIQDSRTLGEHVSAAAKTGGKEVLSAVIGQVIGAAARSLLSPAAQ